MLRWRFISAFSILTVVLALIGLDYRLVAFHTPGAWLLPLLLVVSMLATEEVLSLLRAKGHRPIGWVIYLGNLLIPLAASWPVVLGMVGRGHSQIGAASASLWPLAVLALAAALVLLAEMSRFERPGTAIVDAALGMFTLVYIGVLLSFWGLLRLHGDNHWGMAALFSMLLITKMADTGAFACGKCFGRHKLTPILSPGKTWEGSAGGIAVACLTSVIFFQVGAKAMVGPGYVPPSLLAQVGYGALLALAGMTGDLAESLLKRDMERKDSSTWLRGLGGVLDIIDAPLIAGPVAWVCWTSGLLGP